MVRHENFKRKTRFYFRAIARIENQRGSKSSKEITKGIKIKTQEKRISKDAKRIQANKSRSSKQKKYWRYIKLIRDNFPDLSTNEIRSQLKKRRQGDEVKIQDAIWQNPSP